MINPKNETLCLALNDFRIKELPKEWNRATSTMIDGIALCTKIGGSQEYCKVAFDGDDVVIKKDYGKSETIISIDKIFAVNVLDKKYTPDLRSDKQIFVFLTKMGHDSKSIEALLSKTGKNPESIKADRSKIRELVNREAIKWAKQSLAENERCRNIGIKNRIDNGE